MNSYSIYYKKAMRKPDNGNHDIPNCAVWMVPSSLETRTYEFMLHINQISARHQQTQARSTAPKTT